MLQWLAVESYSQNQLNLIFTELISKRRTLDILFTDPEKYFIAVEIIAFQCKAKLTNRKIDIITFLPSASASL